MVRLLLVYGRAMRLHSPICDLFGIEYPIVLAGMGDASGPELAAAVSNAGGLGVLGGATCTPEVLDEWISRTKRLTDRPFGVDTLLPASVPDRLEDAAPQAARGGTGDSGGDSGGGSGQRRGPLVPDEIREARNEFMVREGLRKPPPAERPAGARAPKTKLGFVGDFFRQQLEVILDHHVPVYVAGLGTPSPELLAKGRSQGMKFMGVAGQSRHVVKLRDLGVDAVVAQGHDGGGHNSPIGTMALIPQAVDAAGGVPILAAGGIADGRGIAAAFVLGAVGVWIGTRFLATEESAIPRFQKEAILAASDRDTMVSRSMSGKPARMLRGSWAEVYERGEMAALPMPLQGLVSGPVMLSAITDDRTDVWPGFAGQGAGLVGDIRPAADVFAELLSDTVARLDGIRSLPGVTVIR